MQLLGRQPDVITYSAWSGQAKRVEVKKGVLQLFDERSSCESCPMGSFTVSDRCTRSGYGDKSGLQHGWPSQLLDATHQQGPLPVIITCSPQGRMIEAASHSSTARQLQLQPDAITYPLVISACA